MQQRPGDLDAPHLPARQIAHLVAGAVGERNLLQHLTGAPARLARPDPMQRRVIDEILLDREVEVERARLEHDADQPQRRARRGGNVVAEDADGTALDGIEARDEGKQRALAGAVEAEEDGKGRRLDGERNVPQRLARPIGVAQALDRQGGWPISRMTGS